jgi:hypothetical protein
VGEIIIFTRARNVREYRIERVFEGDDDASRADGGSTPDR